MTAAGNGAPMPHPLDYDWRFTQETVQVLTSMLGAGSCLVAGAPTLAANLAKRGAVNLVDRQPLSHVENSVTLDVNVASPIEVTCDVAFADPPWYPAEYERWLSWIAQHVCLGGRILCSLWPAEVRPNAAAEREALFASLSPWAEPRLVSGALHYEVPTFEQVARRLEGIARPDVPWRVGDLLELIVREHPALLPPLQRKETWVRFVWNDYQLALRTHPASAAQIEVSQVPGSVGWLWPSVSRRAPGRDLIGLWSSWNEVAMIDGAAEAAAALTLFTARRGTSKDCLPPTLSSLLNEWQIPEAPFWRTFQWTHLA